MSVYKCEICNNVISFVDNRGPPIHCCGQPMTKQEPKTVDKEGKEKHVPVIDGLTIKIGSIPHPMEQEHWIELIQVIIDKKVVFEKRLYPGDVPELTLPAEFEGKSFKVREYCNLHGLWTN